LAITTPAKTSLLRKSLGARSELVLFADWATWYRSPQVAMRRYAEFVKQKVEAGAIWIRVVAEAAWTDDTEPGIAAWTRYESLVNLAFAASPITIICTYDERSLSRAVLADACRTHPKMALGTDSAPSPSYREPGDFLLNSG
jgi:hypothetical protein